jgi:microcystin-dependent protein
MATLLPNVRQQFLDGNGFPLVGGKLYSYAAGTVTPLATYTDKSEGTPNANPVVLDANGMASVWIGGSSYKLQLQDALGNILWTVDNVSSIFDGSVVTSKIAPLAVTTGKIAVGALSADLAGRAIMAAQYIQTTHIGDQQVTAAKIANNALNIGQMVSGFGVVPIGGVIAFFGSLGVPPGFLDCDGASYLRTAYPNLFSAMGTACGAADATHFNVPDLRGMFLRGVTRSTSNDPDAAGRTAQATGGNVGNLIGTVQGDQIINHTHPIYLRDSSGNGTNSQGTNGVTNVSNTSTQTNGGGSETRPKNVYCNFIIKT